MTPREARAALVAGLQADMDGWSVHGSPQVAPPKPPAVVLSPRPTYLRRGTTCTWEVSLTVTLAVSAHAGQDGMDLLDDAVLLAVASILDNQVAQTVVESVSDLVLMQEAGGIEYMTATIQTTTYVT